MPFLRCLDPAAAHAALVAAGGDGLFLFFAAAEPGAASSWCPDCVLSEPVLRATLGRVAPALAVYECPVGTRAAWKGQAEHPYRRHPAFRVSRIPTLIRFRAGVEIGRLVEGPCADPAAITAFLG